MISNDDIKISPPGYKARLPEGEINIHNGKI